MSRRSASATDGSLSVADGVLAYYACTAPQTYDFSDYSFWADLYLSNNYADHSNPVTATLGTGVCGQEGSFTTVAGPKDVIEVTLGESGVFSRDDTCPKIIVDSTTINPEASVMLRDGAAARGAAVVARRTPPRTMRAA